MSPRQRKTKRRRRHRHARQLLKIRPTIALPCSLAAASQTTMESLIDPQRQQPGG